MKRRVSPIALVILKAIGTTGVIIAVLALPGLSVAIAPFLKSPRKQKQLNMHITRLQKRGFIKAKGRGIQRSIQLTKQGAQFLSYIDLWDIVIKKPKKWDKKWRIVMFDFPKRYERNRQLFRSKMLEWGFKQYQKSIFIYPYECKDEIHTLTTLLEVRKCVRYLQVEQLEDGEDYKKIFSL